jgi:hypothetical protein
MLVASSSELQHLTAVWLDDITPVICHYSQHGEK